MAKWGEIKCPRCAELEEQITAMEEGLTAVHMAGYMDGRKAAEAKLDQQDDLVQAAVAAALREAAQAIQGDEMLSPIGAHRVSARILTLITEDAQAALDRVVAAERTMRPIGTAPRDGTYILVTPYGDPTDLQVSWFIEGEDRWANWSWSVEPSHWFPLPAIREGGE